MAVFDMDMVVISRLENEKDNLEVTITQNELPELTEDDLGPYIGDLHNTLLLGSIAEQKAFIKSFIKKIFIDYPTAVIEYTLPLSNFDNSKKEVLVFAHYGRAKCAIARTFKIKVKMIE